MFDYITASVDLTLPLGRAVLATQCWGHIRLTQCTFQLIALMLVFVHV